MAIYRASVSVISRSSGRSAVAAAAYRSGGSMVNVRDGMKHDYSAKSDVQHSEIVKPDNAPDWMGDREQLWNAIELVERRKDAQLSREIQLALPRELNSEQRLELVRSYTQDQFVSKGMVADISIHNSNASDGGEQPHAHVMLTMRNIIGDNFGNKNRDWNAKKQLEVWREKWSEHTNRSLAEIGSEARVDHRSLDKQRESHIKNANELAKTNPSKASKELMKAANLNAVPQPKLGPSVIEMENRGIQTERGDQFRLTQAVNQRMKSTQLQIAKLGEKLENLSKELSNHAKVLVQSACDRFTQIIGRFDELKSKFAVDERGMKTMFGKEETDRPRSKGEISESESQKRELSDKYEAFVQSFRRPISEEQRAKIEARTRDNLDHTISSLQAREYLDDHERKQTEEVSDKSSIKDRLASITSDNRRDGFDEGIDDVEDTVSKDQKKDIER